MYVEEKFISFDIGFPVRLSVRWTVQPDDSVDLIFTVPDQLGTYQIVCGMPGHL